VQRIDPSGSLVGRSAMRATFDSTYDSFDTLFAKEYSWWNSMKNGKMMLDYIKSLDICYQTRA
jgi:hypothetical protein